MDPTLFWFLRLSTFWGRQVWLASFLIALGFYFSLKFLVESFPISAKAKLWTRIVFSLSPIYGFWSVTVSHDATSAIGMMILIGVLLKLFETNSMNGLYKFILIGILTMLTTFPGYIIVGVFVLFILFKERKVGVLATLFAFGLIVFSPIGIDPTRSDVKFRPFLVDIKCVVQHEESVIHLETWRILEKIAPKENWLLETSCASMDGAVSTITTEGRSLAPLSWSEIMPAYFQLLRDNPAIVLMGHI